MDEMYLDVTMSADGKSAFISDWTFEMRAWQADVFRTYMSYKNDFVEVRGKFLTVYVRGLGKNYERCKSFAIWYVTNSESIRTYRLD
jgi:hypothetical protein